MKIRKLKQRGKNEADLEVKILKIYHIESDTLSYRLYFMCPPTKKNNYQYPTMLSVHFPLSNTLRNFEFVCLKSDFAYLIISRCFIISRFFFGNLD